MVLNFTSSCLTCYFSLNSLRGHALSASLLLALLGSSAAQAQAPTITGVSPTRNAPAAPRTTPVAVSFSQSLSNTAATQQALKVFSRQAGGKKAGTATVSGNTLTFTPTSGFKAGETLYTTITSGVQSSSGQSLAQPQVFQFTAATTPSTAKFISQQTNVDQAALCDIDGDGDLDLVGTSVRLNDGTGLFGASKPLLPETIRAFTLGDVDGDGDLDLLTANSFATGTVSVRLNDGAGTFSSSQEVEVGSNPDGIILRDIDADGDLDLLSLDYSADMSTRTLTIQRNNGVGVYGSRQTIVVGASSYTITLGDVDNDGDLDLLTGTGTSLRVRRNNGLGTFSGSQEVTVESDFYQTFLDDLDGDGDLDLVVAGAHAVPNNPLFGSGYVKLYRNDGTGSFDSGQYIGGETNPGSVTTGDMDGDGDLDLITTYTGFRFQPGTVRVRLNDGSGTFTNGALIQTSDIYNNPYSVTLGDVDNDGDLDCITSGNVYINQNLPTITSVSPAAGVVGTTVVITGTNLLLASSVTLNGVVISNFVVNSATQISFILPLSATTGPLVVTTPTGSSSILFTVTPPAVAVTSLAPARNAPTAPRSTDVAVSFSQTLNNNASTLGALKIFSQQSGGRKAGTTSVSGNTLTFNPTTDFKPGETVFATVTRAAQSSGEPSLTIPQVFQFTTATAPSAALFSPGPDVASLDRPARPTLGDVDGDGDLDLLVLNNAGDAVSVRLNAGNRTFTNGQVVPVSSTTKVLLGDMDADGDLDLVTNDGVRPNNGRGSFGTREQGSLIGGTTLGDVDGDGDLDLVTNFQAAYHVRVRLNNGNGTFSEGQLVPVPGNIYAVPYTPVNPLLADLNGDGALDLLTSTGGVVSVRLNNGFGTFDSGSNSNGFGAVSNSSNGEPPANTLSSEIVVGDVDGDGDLDLLRPSSSSVLTVFLNNGKGAFSTSKTVNLGSVGTFVALGDVDGDGDLDILAGGGPSLVNIRLNDGLGNFSGIQNSTVNANPQSIVTGDLDGDGTLDFLTLGVATGAGTASVRLNNHLVLANAPAQVAAQVSLYPNPAHTRVRLSLPAPLARQLLTVRIINTLGQVVLEQPLGQPAPTHNLALPALAPGVYLVHLTTPEGLLTKRLVVD